MKNRPNSAVRDIIQYENIGVFRIFKEIILHAVGHVVAMKVIKVRKREKNICQMDEVKKK